MGKQLKSAKEARERSASNIVMRDAATLMHIAELIDDAVAHYKYEIFVSGIVSAGVTRRLVQEGYKVNWQGQKDNTTRIYWGD